MRTNRRRTVRHLVCPVCGAPARKCPPRRWFAATGPRPRWSHTDGEALCPMMGATGYRPADPHPAPPARRARRRVGTPAGAPTTDVDVASGPGPVYVVAGGDMDAVFTDRDSAAIEYMVMVGANLEPIARTVRADRWAVIRARLIATVPGLVVVDLRAGGDR
ncbi:hypothetical protein [Actinoplanes teichomyceticus]|uniref:Uncharacterized protein n=1 Tax=Actinoplanes teichomyceticus TaxID=1867 RepID=A0A561VSF4_ACTTI|nr:hypothetical protein [Actinoplanes teichomyceticus]TWG14528.1 hypothetical protein FHX34_104828 [Actinoplanes teichomyceticus]GIF16873.1 hypothetical protein Ate01nite_69050 [Actinoplanes teichomyceticus]